MLERVNIENILFLDIETVPQHPDYNELNDSFKHLWDKKAGQLARKEEDTPSALYERAGIYAEFGKIICISVAHVSKLYNEYQVRVKSFYSDDEKELLSDFFKMVSSRFSGSDHILCGHNAKEFDFPFIARRALINGLKLPLVLDIAGKKPWEVMHLDTMELWKFGDYKSYTSLALLAAVFGIPTPKDDIDGSQVGNVYWKDNDLERIATYCQKDVLTVVQLFLKYRGEELIPDERIEFVK